MRRIASKALRAATLTLTCLALAAVPTPPQEPLLQHRDGPEGTAVWVPWRVTCTEDMICWDGGN